MIVIEALLFILSSGLLFSRQFRDNAALVVVAGVIALAASYFLGEQIWSRWVAPLAASGPAQNTIGMPANPLQKATQASAPPPPLRLEFDPDNKIPVLNTVGLDPEVERVVVQAESAADAARLKVMAAQRRVFDWQYAENKAKANALIAKRGTRGDMQILRWDTSTPEDSNTGCTYSGEVELLNTNETPNGYGVCVWANFDQYSGQWRDGKRTGPGRYDDHHYGYMYADWMDGEANSGLMTFSNRLYLFLGSRDDGIDVGYAKPSGDYAAVTDVNVIYLVGQMCRQKNDVCYVVEVEKDGNIYAGQTVGGLSLSGDNRNGRGAIFDGRGNVVKQGTWIAGKLSQ